MTCVVNEIRWRCIPTLRFRGRPDGGWEAIYFYRLPTEWWRYSRAQYNARLSKNACFNDLKTVRLSVMFLQGLGVFQKERCNS